MDNNLFLADQKFGAGDGFLVCLPFSLQQAFRTQASCLIEGTQTDRKQNYYLYNWQCAPIDGGTRGGVAKQGSGIGVVML